ncbi:MAG: bis(5'-nucleosyl)-tetraphosphatase (symmetrical) YqeK [Oscillospiraceae bacterium]|nr:bis(5'-nucleosyl)-tetraphosphatase (symmetrical) YqeK [Oscillospiraceae bacterium]
MDFEDYKQIIKKRMGKKRFIHSVNVSKEAVKLAEKYGADVEKAQIAGILHDITKETPPEEQLKIMSDNGIILDNVQKSSQKLWHAVSGSAYVKSVLGITDEDILNAIRYHTSGRANMSLLEKVIFIADFTGEERDYDGVDIMREKAYRNLEEAMAFGLAFTISDLAKRNLPIHKDALEAYNEIIIKNSN